MNPYLDALSALIQPVRAESYPPTLEPMQRLLANLGDPQKTYPTVVVAGSTGKGMTCARLAARLRAAGLRVGLYTSPHLHSFRERFRIDGAEITPEAFAALATEVRTAQAGLGRRSTFESATALALTWFARREVDIAVLEVGLGGRFDAVNAAPNRLALITRLELEHAAMLGGTLESIAWHKAGVIAPGGVALTVRQDPRAFAVLRDEAAARGARLTVVPGDPLASPAGLDGLVAAAVETLADLLPDGEAPPAPIDSALPGRLEEVVLGDKSFLIDGGHTALAAHSLASAIHAVGGPVRLVVGMLADKDAGAYLRAFDSAQYEIVLTTAPGHRAADPEMLRAAAGLTAARVTVTAALDEALAAALNAPERQIVIAGSLRMAAAAREYLGLLPEPLLVEARATRALFEGSGYLARLG